MSAWVSKEWTEAGKRRREMMKPGTKGVKEADAFIVEWWDDARGKRCRKKIKERGRVGKQLADDLASKVNAKMTLGQYQPAVIGTWREAKERFIRDIVPRMRAEASQSEIKATLERFEKIILPTKIAEISTSTIEQFAAARQRGSDGDKKVRPTTVNKDLRNLKTFFRKLLDWEIVQRLPKFEMLPETELEKPIYTDAEFVAMYKACDAAKFPSNLPPAVRTLWWQALMAVYWETGCRRMEPLKLRWEHVDLENRRFRITAENTKTRREREYTFGEFAENHLRALAAFRISENVFEWRYDHTMLNKELKRIQAAAGIAGKRNLAFHALRRNVGNMIAELYGIDAAQNKLGHTSASITAKHYAGPAMRQRAAKSLMPIPGELESKFRVVGNAG